MKIPGQPQNEPYTLNLKMKKNQTGMFLVNEIGEKTSNVPEKMEVGERITYTGNAIDNHRLNNKR